MKRFTLVLLVLAACGQSPVEPRLTPHKPHPTPHVPCPKQFHADTTK